jgi:UDP-glucose 4-epimerase
VLSLAEAVAAAAGVDPAEFAPEFQPARPGEVVRSCLDISRARADLDLGAPTVLTDGLRATLDWVRTLPEKAPA